MNKECMEKGPITEELLTRMNGWWRAANYLSAGQLYLLENPLLRKPLTKEMIKKKIVGHWGTVPGQNFVFVHLNRVIKKYDLDVILLSGPGHGGNFYIANEYLDGTYSETYPNISQDEAGMAKLFKQFSFPGGVASHCAPEIPGSINEGGELGYGVAHAFGAVFDNPDLIAAVTVGDGEAETGPLATSWQSNKFLNPIGDGAVLPILHLNGYKIANPTIFARMSHEEIVSFFHGCGWEPYFVEGDDPMSMHRKMAETMDTVIEKIRAIQKHARENNDPTRPVWPMIVLRTPKGWTGPKEVDGKKIEGYFLAHQVPVSMEKPEHLEILEKWLKSYHAEELFDDKGRLVPEIAELSPEGNARIGKNPHANGGLLLRDLRLPDFRDYGIDVKEHGAVEGQDMSELGKYVRDIFKLNEESKNALDNLKRIYELLCLYGFEKYVSIDLGMLESIDYYTGSIFKCYTHGVGFPICAGGRYDNLMGQFGDNKGAVGAAIGINRLISVLSDKEVHDVSASLVFAEKNAEGIAYDIAYNLRVNGCLVEMYIGDGDYKAAEEYSKGKNIGAMLRVFPNGQLMINDFAKHEIIETTANEFLGYYDESMMFDEHDHCGCGCDHDHEHEHHHDHCDCGHEH